MRKDGTIYRFLSDAALLIEARVRLGLDGVLTLMGWANRRAYDTDLSRCVSGDRRYSLEQRAKLIEAITKHAKADERERDEIRGYFQSITRQLETMGGAGRAGPKKKQRGQR
jgi:hypothetical protein